MKKTKSLSARDKHLFASLASPTKSVLYCEIYQRKATNQAGPARRLTPWRRSPPRELLLTQASSAADANELLLTRACPRAAARIYTVGE
jgi:hypothetical protein